MVDLKRLFMSDEWAQHKLNPTKVGQKVGKLMFDHSYWDKVAKVISLYKPLYVVLWLMDLEVVSTMAFVYKLMQVMKENLIRQHAREWVFQIIKDHWEKNTKTSISCGRYLWTIYLHKFLLLIYLIFSYKILTQLSFIVAYFLNPRFQYKHRVGSDPKLLQATHDVFAKLNPTVESLNQLGNEVNKKLLFYLI